MENFKETCVTRIQGDDHIGVYTAEQKFINKIVKNAIARAIVQIAIFITTKIDKEIIKLEQRETCITRLENDTHIGVYTSEVKFINQIKKLKEEYPNEVIINHINPDGSICVNLPYDWFRLPKPKAKRNFTPEQKAAMVERMKKARETKAKEN